MTTQTKASQPSRSGSKQDTDAKAAAVNEVHLVGRLSAPPVVKHLPSGAEVVQLRIVVDRPAGTRAKTPGDVSRSPTVDTIDIACWSAESRRRAMSCAGHEVIDVSGALRRRFWRGPAGVASRYEVEAGKLRVIKRAA
ncbi:single-stranded DNA-binding protein [Flexivirga alba]|uniref:Single-stranded DNA-binding protein n=1 Tax=Flexivirga alba TaxID=702742 RepID=A0ABW2AKQ7_9MICO